jgi:uncharacterized membrane protein
MKNIILISILASIFIVGCYYDNEEELYPNSQPAPNDTTTQAASWTADVKPIMDSRCATNGCHVSGQQSPALQTYDQVFNNRVRVQVRACQQKTMPPSAPLSNTDVNKLNSWINAGAPNN